MLKLSFLNGHTDVHVEIIEVASLFTSYITAKVIIPEGLNSIGQF